MARVTLWQEVGGLVGRILLAILAVRIVSRRFLLRVFQIPALLYVPLLFWWISTQLPNTDSLMIIKWGVFLAGVLTVAQFSFWGNYLPRVYPVHLRGTGESFAANVGGRIIGTSFAWITVTIAGSEFMKSQFPDKTPFVHMAYTAAGVAAFVYLAGLILSRWLPEPTGEHD